MRNIGWAAVAALFLTATMLSGAAAQNAAPAGNQANDQQTNQQLEAIRTAGYNAGFRDGVTDYRNRSPYDFKNQPVYQNADQSYSSASGISQQTYQNDFRTGYEAGYDDGYYGRSSSATAERQRTYSPPAASNAAAAQPGSNAAASAGTLPVGTTMAIKLNNTLSTDSSRPGDSFAATVAAPVNDPNGQVVVPVGSTITGTVASVQRSGSLSGSSQIQLNFQNLALPDGTRLPLRAEVSQITSSAGIGGIVTGTPTTTSEGGVEQSQTRRSAGTAAAGGAAGVIIGAIAGGGKGAGIGGLVGAGLGAVLASRNGNLTLPAGTAMDIKLNSPLTIR